VTTSRTRIITIASCLIALSAFAFVARSRAADAMPTNTLTEQEQKDGWKLLFDGKSTDGWRAYKGDKMPEKWKVANGVLVLDQSAEGSGGDVVTVDEYDNFELAADWKISPGGNSGIMYHVVEDGQYPWLSGPEYQLLDNAGHADGRKAVTSAASCYALYAPSKDVTKPVGEWNHTRIIVNGPHVEHWLNGEKVAEYEIGSEDWQKRVQASKFGKMPNFAKASKGHIDLQDHGDGIAFRNIKLRPLPASQGK
jgi:Domain of Unknown Function (DUF1080)